MTQPVDILINGAHADILIIGAGASGAALAWSLADTRMRIVCLEQGDWMNPATSPPPAAMGGAQLRRLRLQPEPRAARGTTRSNDDDSPIKIANFNAVGGGTILYGGHFPRFHPSDFRVRSLDGVADDWPVGLRDTRAVLRPERPHDGRVRPGGRPGLSRRSSQLMPPLPLGRAGATLAAGFNATGLALVAVRQRHRLDRL